MGVTVDLVAFAIVIWAISAVMVFNMYWLLIVQQRTIDPLLEVIQASNTKMSTVAMYRMAGERQ